MIVYEFFDIMHDLGVSPMGGRSHLCQDVTALLVRCCRLRMKNERDCQKPLSEY